MPDAAVFIILAVFVAAIAGIAGYFVYVRLNTKVSSSSTLTSRVTTTRVPTITSLLPTTTSSGTGTTLTIQTTPYTTQTTPKKEPPPSGPGPLPVTESNWAMVTQGNQDRNVPQANRPYYTLAALQRASQKYPEMTSGDLDEQRRVVSVFLANVQQETGFFTALETRCQTQLCEDYGKDYATADGCNATTLRCRYYGRGPLQTTWSPLYGRVSQHMYGDDRLVQRPWIVSEDPVAGWGAALYFYCKDPGVNWDKGGKTMLECAKLGDIVQACRAINGALECDGGKGAYNQLFRNRLDNYRRIAGILGVKNLGFFRPDCNF